MTQTKYFVMGDDGRYIGEIWDTKEEAMEEEEDIVRDDPDSVWLLYECVPVANGNPGPVSWDPIAGARKAKK